MQIFRIVITSVALVFGTFLLQPRAESITTNDTSIVPKIETGYEQGHVFREVQMIIQRNADEYFQEFLHTPLKVFLPGTNKIAGVERTKPLTENEYPEIGSIRQVNLKDGESAKEQSIDLQPRYFKYKVTDYSLKLAKPIEYGLGEFWFIPLTDHTTLIRWKYSFKLKEDVFPGNLGGIGRALFKWSFLDSDYAEYMNVGINAIKAHAERDLKTP